MNSLLVKTIVLVAILGAFWFVYSMGKSHGALQAQAHANQATINALQASITEYADLIEASRKASLELREQLANREAADEKSTTTLRTILAASRTSRDACRFDDDSMRSIAAARSRAAAAAATGIGREVSGSSVTDEQPPR